MWQTLSYEVGFWKSDQRQGVPDFQISLLIPMVVFLSFLVLPPTNCLSVPSHMSGLTYRFSVSSLLQVSLLFPSHLSHSLSIYFSHSVTKLFVLPYLSQALQTFWLFSPLHFLHRMSFLIILPIELLFLLQELKFLRSLLQLLQTELIVASMFSSHFGFLLPIIHYVILICLVSLSVGSMDRNNVFIFV